MALKKYTVHVSYHTYADVEVVADESCPKDEILELGRQRAAEDSEEMIHEILGNCEEDGNTEIIEVKDAFLDKYSVYDALCNAVGGYVLIGTPNRPTFKIADCDDFQVYKKVKVKSLYMSDNTCSPLKMIDENDESWDVDDYLGQDEIENLYSLVMSAKENN